MMPGPAMRLYWTLPVRVQEALLGAYACHLDGLYYGNGYAGWVEECRREQQWSRTEAERWQNDRLSLLVERAATRVPYYRWAWRRADWRAVRSAADLQTLPVVEKQSIRGNEMEFMVETVDAASLWETRTSGTTGTALRLYWPRSMLPRYWAIIEVMVRGAAGVSRDCPRAMMGGRTIIRGDTSRPPFWRFIRRWRQLYLSSYHVGNATARSYLRAIREYDSVWITGYGSAIAALAEGADGAAAPLRAAIVSGDTLLPEMRASIEECFACKCLDHYGQSEGVCMAMECGNGRMHIIPAVGIVEILDENGAACGPGEVGEIVATGLLNEVMPLIRYRTGDYAAWAEERTCPCGNTQRVLSGLEGRVDDYLVTADGRRIGRLSTAMKGSPSIHSIQIVQDRPGHGYVLCRPGGGYHPWHGQAVCEAIRERIGSFDLEVVEVAEIPRTARGKRALVIRASPGSAEWQRYEVLLGVGR